MIGYGRADTHHAWDGVRPEMSMGARAFKRRRGAWLAMIRVAWAKLHRGRVWQGIRVGDSGSFGVVCEGWLALPESLSGWGEARDSHDWHTTPAQAGVQLGRSM